MKVDLQLVGLDQMLAAMGRGARQLEQSVEAGVYGAANNVMSAAKRLTPLDMGTLRGSGYVALPVREGGQAVVEIGFGGPAKRYAVPVHEDTRAKNYQTPGTGPKFLERAYDAASGTWSDDVARLAAEHFENGSGLERGPHPTTPDEGG